MDDEYNIILLIMRDTDTVSLTLIVAQFVDHCHNHWVTRVLGNGIERALVLLV